MEKAVTAFCHFLIHVLRTSPYASSPMPEHINLEKAETETSVYKTIHRMKMYQINSFATLLHSFKNVYTAEIAHA